MKKFKKLSALLLAAIMVLTMAMPVMAANSEDKVVLSVSNVTPGATVTFYKVVEVTYHGTGETNLNPREQWFYAQDAAKTADTNGKKNITIGDGDGFDLPETNLDGKAEDKIQSLAARLITTDPATKVTVVNSEIKTATAPTVYAADGTYYALVGGGFTNQLPNSSMSDEQLAQYVKWTEEDVAKTGDAREIPDGAVAGDYKRAKISKATTADKLTPGVWIAVVTDPNGKETYNPMLLSATYSGDDFAPNAEWVRDDENGNYFKVIKDSNGQELSKPYYTLENPGDTMVELDGTTPVKYKRDAIVNADGTYQVTAVAKSSTPTVKKEITSGTTNDDLGTNDTTDDKPTASLGDVIGYKVTPALPTYPVNAINKTIWFEDNMCEGLTFLPNSFQVTVGSEKLWVEADELASKVTTNPNIEGNIGDHAIKNSNGDYVGFVKFSTTTPNGFRVVFDYEKLVVRGTDGAISTYNAPVLEYAGRLNEKVKLGVTGNENHIKYTYSNSTSQGNTHKTTGVPDAEGNTTEEDEKVVYTYEISVMKIDEAIIHDATKFTQDTNGIFYKVTTKENNQDVVTFTTVPPTDSTKATYQGYVEGANPQVYTMYRANSGLEGAEFEVTGPDGKITTIVSNANGIATLSVAAAGEYTLKETKAPAGYQLSADAANNTVVVTANWLTATKTTSKKATTTTYKVLSETDYAADNTKQIGWIVADTNTAATGRFYEKDAFSELLITGNYTDDVNHGKWQYIPGELAMKRIFNRATQEVKFVYRAQLDKTITNSESSQQTITNPDPAKTPGGVVFTKAVLNSSVAELPSTGGMGTYLFTIAGIAIMGVAAFLLIVKRRRA